MTDTSRQDFEAWYNRRFSNRESDDCCHGSEDMLETWQASKQDTLALLESEDSILCGVQAYKDFCNKQINLHGQPFPDGIIIGGFRAAIEAIKAKVRKHD